MKGCSIADCQLVGGETAEMPGTYEKGKFDIAGFSVGIVDQNKILNKKKIKKNNLILGSRLGFNSTFYSYDNINKDASIIHCEIDENSIGRYFPVEIGIFADAKTVAEQLLTMLKSHQAKNEAQQWVDDFQAERKAYLENRDQDADVTSTPI